MKKQNGKVRAILFCVAGIALFAYSAWSNLAILSYGDAGMPSIGMAIGVGLLVYAWDEFQDDKAKEIVHTWHEHQVESSDECGKDELSANGEMKLTQAMNRAAVESAVASGLIAVDAPQEKRDMLALAVQAALATAKSVDVGSGSVVDAGHESPQVAMAKRESFGMVWQLMWQLVALSCCLFICLLFVGGGALLINWANSLWKDGNVIWALIPFALGLFVAVGGIRNVPEAFKVFDTDERPSAKV